MARGDDAVAEKARVEHDAAKGDAHPKTKLTAAEAAESLDPEAVAERVFGFTNFRPGQRRVLDAVLAGRDALAIMPTGGGKSLCYQLPALITPGLTLVVSPLLALMREQVATLKALGAPAEALNSENDAEEDARVRAALLAGSVKLLYCAPERLARSDMTALLKDCDLRMIAVDEAHCVAEWGHDFRPDYLCVGAFRERIARFAAAEGGRKPQLCAFTATADADTRAEILEKLFGAAEPDVFIEGFDRPNIRFGFEHKKNAKARILDFVRRRPGQSGVIYCASRRGVEQIAEHLNKEGAPCLVYHAGLTTEQRQANQAAFSEGQGVLMAATVAFGMGVDKRDIRFVIHADLPKTVESYYQEVGRAGRDGEPAEALALYGLEDMRRRRRAVEVAETPAPRKAADRARLAAMMRLAEAPVCRRQTLLAYFGETLEQPCGRCDLCESPRETYDGTIEAQKALSAVARTGERYGVGHLVAILRGEATDLALSCGHQTLPTFGCGAELDRVAWRAIYRQLFAQGLIDTDGREACAFSLTAEGRAVLKGERAMLLRRDPAPVSKAAAQADREAALIAELKRARRDWAASDNMSPALILSDRALVAVAQARPRDVKGLRGCSGVPPTTVTLFGERILDIVRRSV